MAAQTVRSGIESKSLADKNGKVLPVPGERNVLVTSALPYVNNAPHLGNIIGSTLSADVYARYCRSRGFRTIYICGTDEYGTTTETKALADGVTPRELCDKYHKVHADSYAWFQIGFDQFGRTSTPQQTDICQDIFLKLYNNGYLESKSTDQLYCESNKKFLADRYVEGTCPICGYDDARGDQCDKCTNQLQPTELIQPRCKLSGCKTAPIIKTSTHLFIKLKEMQPLVEEFTQNSSKTGIWSDNAKAMTRGWLKMGLESRAMTRDLSWGVPVPLEGWEGKVMYVWFDAPIGYPSITAAYTDQWEKWWRDPENVELVQFMGKDNVPFHTLLFPAYLIGSKDRWTKLNSISTTEYLNYEGTKFSKSRSIGVFGENARDTGVPASVWRYFLLANRPEGSDSQFMWKDFIVRNNTELVNNLGNFVQRAIKFAAAKYDSVVPSPTAPGDATPDWATHNFFSAPEEQKLVEDIEALLQEYASEMDQIKIRSGLDKVMAFSARCNSYLQTRELGNKLLEERPQDCATLIVVAVNLIYVLSALVHPFMPAVTEDILAQVQAPARTLPTKFTVDIWPGHKLGEPKHLFTRIDPKKEDVWRKQFGGDAVQESAPPESKKAKAKAAKAQSRAKEPVFEGQKPLELVDLEQKIDLQGQRVRKIKAGEQEGVTAIEVEALMKLKQERSEIIEKLNALQLQ